MIQELLGGNNVGFINKPDQRSKLSNPSCLDHGSPSSSSTTSSAAAAASGGGGASENLRCPRCDSSNTKFCYYNNYNLTQPRHFCKTCRRYWTKGGALRNVPIGGGCRKNKTTTIASVAGKSVGKLRTVSSEMIKTGLFGGFEHADQAQAANPILWASSSPNHHFLSLLRANQNSSYPNNNNNDNNNNNHHHLPHPVSVKEEGCNNNTNNFLFGSSSSTSRVTGLDPLGSAHAPYSSSLYRNQTPASQGFVHGDQTQNSGLQELYQRLRSSSATNFYYPENTPVIHGNMAAANSSAILESAPVGTGELGFWNPALAWSADLPTTNGAYP